LFDWLIGLLSCWLTGGLFLDGWVHNHLRSMETVFTPWHAVLYSGFAAIMTTLALARLRGLYDRRPLTAAVPEEYELSALGVLLFGLGGVPCSGTCGSASRRARTPSSAPPTCSSPRAAS